MTSSDDDEQFLQVRKRIKHNTSSVESGIYLDTVNRQMLDFDFEKVCSVSLSNLNVYACLVCGKYFQGRGSNSHAYFHALQEDHHVFINLSSLKVYVLPDGYEVQDASMSDIKHVIRPLFTKDEIQQLDKVAQVSYDLHHKRYLAGFVGLNNIKANDYVNTIVHVLCHVQPLRDYFLSNEKLDAPELVQRFGMLVRKIWNLKAFKAQVSPHELLQEISNSSSKRFTLSIQSDPIDFLSWFLNNMHMGLKGPKKKSSSIIHEVFQGELQMESQIIDDKTGGNNEKKFFDRLREIKAVRVPFMFLSLDLPPPPLFQDESEKNIIPQVPIASLLSKYDGVTEQETLNMLRRFKITKLPQFLIFHVKRFNKNNFTLEKNPTIVNYPISNLDMREYVDNPDQAGETRYDLVANICHQGLVDSGVYKAHLKSKSNGQWYEIQDLFVEEIKHELICLSETYIQVWERKCE